MISKISSFNINFKGTCKIGKNKEEREKIAQTIQEIPENNRNHFINSLNILKNSLAANTKSDKSFTIHLAKYDDDSSTGEKDYNKGIYVDVFDESDDIWLARRGVRQRSFGIDSTSHELKENISATLNGIFFDIYNSVTPKQEPPKTKDEILDRLA